MKLMQWTIFLDMLGYGQRNGSIKNDEEASQFIAFMEENKKLLVAQENNQDMKDKYKKEWFNLYEWYDVKFAFISDSFVLTMVPKEVNKDLDEKVSYLHSANVLFIISMRIFNLIFFALAKEKLFIRGGISNKFCNIQNEFVVGEGLIEAYNLESKKAIYPRILLSKEITNNTKIMDSLKFISKKMYTSNYLIKKDFDNYFYLDYLKFKISQSDPKSLSFKIPNLRNSKQDMQGLQETISYINFHKQIIEENILRYTEKVNNENNHEKKEKYINILKKYEWSKKYHNMTLEHFPEYKLGKIL